MDRQDRQNVLVAVLVVLLIGVTYWIMSAMTTERKLEECLQQRRRNCEQLVR